MTTFDPQVLAHASRCIQAPPASGHVYVEAVFDVDGDGIREEVSVYFVDGKVCAVVWPAIGERADCVECNGKAFAFCHDDDRWSIECDRCEACSQLFGSEREATDAWNAANFPWSDEEKERRFGERA